MSDIDEEEERDAKIRESFQLLTQGVEMDPDHLRICVDEFRPSNCLNDQVPFGVYLRDVSEVRAGIDAFDFTSHPDPPGKGAEDTCLVLIATEGCICLQLPTTFSRDWFFERFTLLVDDVWSSQQKVIKSKLNWTSTSRRFEAGTQSDIARQMKLILQEGIRVLYHQRGGYIHRALLRHDTSGGGNRIQLAATEKGCVSSWREVASLSISDIVEIRPGTHSYVFAQSGCLEFENECFSLVGTECTLDIQVLSREARDLLVHKMKYFIDSWTADDNNV